MRVFIILLGAFFLSAGTAYAEEQLITQAATKEITLMGFTREHKAMSVYSEVPGKVLKVNYEVGDTAGAAPFIELDTTFVSLDIESTDKSIGRLEVALKQADSRVAYLEKEFWRIDTLHKGDRATEVRRDAAAQELEQAKLERDSMKLELEGLQTKLSELKEKKERHSIRIPSGWVLTGRTVEKGEVVQPGVPLGKASDFRRLVVPLSVTSEELGAIKALSAEFGATLDSRPARARLNWVNPEFDENTRKRSIEILITKYEGQRSGGLRFILPVKVKTDGILVPRAAINDRYANPRVSVKVTGEVIPVIVTGESGDYAIVAEDGRIAPGTELLPAR